MTTEELLIKRVKVIANYPGSTYSIGDILYEVDRMLQKFVLKNDDRNFKYIQYPQDYPVIFEPLPWWKDRKVEDMPIHLHCPSRKTFHKIDKWENESFMTGGKIKKQLANYIPATKEEYESYLQTANQLNNGQ